MNSTPTSALAPAMRSHVSDGCASTGTRPTETAVTMNAR